jgi:hypothetical protein
MSVDAYYEVVVEAALAFRGMDQHGIRNSTVCALKAFRNLTYNARVSRLVSVGGSRRKCELDG